MKAMRITGITTYAVYFVNKVIDIKILVNRTNSVDSFLSKVINNK